MIVARFASTIRSDVRITWFPAGWNPPSGPVDEVLLEADAEQEERGPPQR